MALSALGGSKLPGKVVNACLTMMGATWDVTQRHFLVAPLTTVAVLFVVGSFLWALLRSAAALVNTRRVLARSEGYAPGQYPKLDGVTRDPAFRQLPLRLLDSTRPLAFTLGLWYPQVVLSEGMVSALSAEELRAVLCHELGHVRRRDPLRLALARFLADALWFLPVARSLARDFVDAVEEGADDWAVEATRQPVELAAALVKTARAGAAQAIPVGTSLGGSLSVEDRVGRLLGMGAKRPLGTTTKGKWLASASIGLVLLIMLTLPLGAREVAAQRAIAQPMRAMPMMSCSVGVW
jgi:Zn-dependent protease with chaperone function